MVKERGISQRDELDGPTIQLVPSANCVAGAAGETGAGYGRSPFTTGGRCSIPVSGHERMEVLS
jgi:hypothetical protein